MSALLNQWILKVWQVVEGKAKRGRGRAFDVLQKVLKHLQKSAFPSLVAT